MSAVRSFCTGVALRRLLSVTPTSSMVDSRVDIKATGLETNSRVTIRSVVEQDTRNGLVKFEGHAHYIADDRGVVSVADQTALEGTYCGADPMGLFWSMLPSPGQRLGARIMTNDVTKPMVVQLSLHGGHLDMETLQMAEPEGTTTAERWYMGKDVERITVQSGRLRGTLFKPKGSGPFPGVIDMYGSTGGLTEIRAAMLASHGLACYALPYFKYDDLPSHMWNLELEYFKLENAANCQFLFVVSEADRMWDSCYYARKAMQRLARHGCHNCQLLSYPNAGHVIEIPYAPAVCVTFSLFLGKVFNLGGRIKDTAKANEDCWPKIVKFLHTHTGSDCSKL